jgi:PAS domain S-box-containing protein
MNQRKTGIKAAIAVAIFTIALMLFQFFYIGVVLKNEAEKHSKEIASQTAQKIASSVEVYFRDALTVTQTYSRNFLVYRQVKLPRETAYRLMKGSVKLNNNFLAIWTMWEPNAYDNSDIHFTNDTIHDSKGSFAIAFYYDGDNIKREINDTSDFYEDFYTIPKKFKQAVILDPFYYQYHGNSKTYFETSLVSPIIEDKEFLGVIGIDIDMYALQAKYNAIRILDDGFICLLSNSGTIVTHKFPDYIEKNITTYTQNEKSDVADSLKSGKEFTTESNSVFSNEPVVRYYYPININYMAAPWYVMIEIPKRKILEATNSIKLISTILLVASLILLFYLFYNIADRGKREKKLLETLEKVELGESLIREADALIIKNERILDAIFNQTFSFVGLLSTDGKIMRVNKPALDFIKKEEKDLIGLPFSDSPWWNGLPEEKAKLLHALKAAAAGTHSTFETVNYNSKKEPTKVLFSIKPIFGDDGSILFLLPEGIDITKIKETEQELKKYQEHLEELVNLRTQEIQQLNEELLASNEELHLVNERILEQKEALQASLNKLQETQKKLIQSEKMASLGILSAGIAHEINNPLNFINGGTLYMETFLKDNFPSHYEEIKPVIEGIQTGIKRATIIVKSLNQYSRGDSLPYSLCNLHEIIDDCLVMLHNQFKNRIEVQKYYSESQHEILGNEGKLHQAFLNVLANAGHAIDNKGNITITTDILKDKIRIVIADDGHGISPENLKNIFDPFFTTKEPGKGTGLGLSITYSIIQEHDGTIEFESNIGKGTKVTLKFPLKPIIS